MKISDIVSADGVVLSECEQPILYALPDRCSEYEPEVIKGYQLAWLDEKPPRVAISTHYRWYTKEDAAVKLFVSRPKCLAKMAEMASQHAYALLSKSAAAV